MGRPSQRAAGPLREGSRLYSYLLRGQHHCPETTQPTTSPRRRPRSGRVRTRHCPTPSPAPAWWSLATRAELEGWAGAGQVQGRRDKRAVPRFPTQCSPHPLPVVTGRWDGRVPSRGAGVRSAPCFLLRHGGHGGPCRPRPVPGWAGRGEPWASLPSQLPRPPRAQGSSSWCPVPAMGMWWRRVRTGRLVGLMHRMGGQGAGCTNRPVGAPAVSTVGGEGRPSLRPSLPWARHAAISVNSHPPAFHR